MAGIKIWMLTGDKMDTAYNIGLSCNLISNDDLQIFRVCGEKGESVQKLLEEYNDFIKYDTEVYDINNINNNVKNKPFSILIDSSALSGILASEKEDINRFLSIAINAKAVICCRVTPLQKAEVVRIVKTYNKKAVTLSIGDGGNDVSMIMEAHIGKINIY
jgi:magnesium-transporting ATPase (P-type)